MKLGKGGRLSGLFNFLSAAVTSVPAVFAFSAGQETKDGYARPSPGQTLWLAPSQSGKHLAHTLIITSLQSLRRCLRLSGPFTISPSFSFGASSS